MTDDDERRLVLFEGVAEYDTTPPPGPPAERRRPRARQRDRLQRPRRGRARRDRVRRRLRPHHLLESRSRGDFGHTAAEAVGQPLTLIIPERFRHLHEDGMERYLATGKPKIIGRPVELAGLRKDGSEFPGRALDRHLDEPRRGELHGHPAQYRRPPLGRAGALGARRDRRVLRRRDHGPLARGRDHELEPGRGAPLRICGVGGPQQADLDPGARGSPQRGERVPRGRPLRRARRACSRRCESAREVSPSRSR